MTIDCFEWKKGLPPNLVELDVSFTNLDDTFFYEISHSNIAANLKTLKLRGTKIGNSFLSHFHKFASLEYLDIRDTLIQIENDFSIEKLSKLANLKTLKVDKVELTLAKVLQANTKLENVTVTQQTKVGSSKIYLKDFMRLKSFTTNLINKKTLSYLVNAEKIKLTERYEEQKSVTLPFRLNVNPF